MKKKRDVIQGHHITYNPELIVKVYQTEHWVITQLQRFKSLSEGAKQAIKFIIDTKETREIKE